jgi:DNA-binding IclR family transcriptional regulator
MKAETARSNPGLRRQEAGFAKEKSIQTGIDSIETGMRLLLAFAELGGRSHQLKVLAEKAEMPPSKAHRYLVSFIRMGFVDRDSLTGHYRLGPKTIELGASALDAMDAFALSVELMIELHDELDHTMALTVWGSHSPVIVRVEEADRLMTVSFRVGKSLPLLASAAGLVFSSFLPRPLIEPLIHAEIRKNRERGSGNPVRSMAEAERLIDEVRSKGLARIAGSITSGINAMAAPVFDHRGHPATAISAIGPAGSFDYGWTGSVGSALLRRTSELSRKLGFRRTSVTRQREFERSARVGAHDGAGPSRRSAKM